MPNPLTVFAIVEASDADMPCVEASVADLARHSRDEPGCLRYDAGC